MNTSGVKSYFFKKKKTETPKSFEFNGSWYMEPKNPKTFNKEQLEIEKRSKELKSVKLSNPPVWTDVYSLPFTENHGWIYDSNKFF